MTYSPEITTEIFPMGNVSNLPASQSVAPTREGSQIDAVMRLSQLAYDRPRDEAQALKKCLAAADPSWVWRVPNRGEGLSVKYARSIVRHYATGCWMRWKPLEASPMVIVFASIMVR